jgi:hypothetical protein
MNLKISELHKIWTAAGLELSLQRYYVLAKGGRLPSPIRGEVDPIEVMTHLCIFYRDLAREGDPHLTAERARLTKANADLKELRLLVELKKLVNADRMKHELGKTFSGIRQKLLAIPSRAAAQCSHMTAPEIFAFLTDEIYSTLTALSEGDYSTPNTSPHKAARRKRARA